MSLITDTQISNALNGRGKRSYMCTWANGVQKRIWADTKEQAKAIAREWAIRFEYSPPRNATPIMMWWDKED